MDKEPLEIAFADSALRDIQDAVAELEAEGMVSCSHSMSEAVPHIRPLPDLFVTFDPLAHGHNPVDDAAELSARVLEGNDSVAVADLHEATGWPLRRFNPAVSLVISQVDEGRVSKEMGSEYPSRCFHLLAEDRVALKRFLSRLKQ